MEKNIEEKNIEEKQYLDLLDDVLKNGQYREDRTGVGTYSIFGRQLRFNLREGRLPLLTTKRVYWKGVIEELIFFLRGLTNNRYLSERGVHIWDGNTSRKYLDSIGLNDYEKGDLGPAYGFQWRHFGAEYKGCWEDYTGQGVDQIQKAIELIKKNPTSRRIYVTAWNPEALDQMCLPPCHLGFQLYVDIKKRELSCQMYQRSVDCFLGLPFNIASYAALTNIIADICGLRPGELIICLGDTHIYSNHVGQCKQQMQREPREFPRLLIKKSHKTVDEYDAGDFEVIGYKPHPTIKANLAI